MFGNMCFDIKKRENICIFEPGNFEYNKYFVYTNQE